MITGLGHVGLHVRDTEVSKRFYSDLLGLTVTDENAEGTMVFMSAQPDAEHHELLLCAGRDAPPDVHVLQQVSFHCAELTDVVDYHRRLVEAGVEIDRVISHGNAVGVYFFDPDHNRCEVYWHTGLEARQPYGEPVDLSRPVEEIIEDVRASVAIHGKTGFVAPQPAASAPPA